MKGSAAYKDKMTGQFCLPVEVIDHSEVFINTGGVSSEEHGQGGLTHPGIQVIVVDGPGGTVDQAEERKRQGAGEPAPGKIVLQACKGHK